MMEHTYMLFIVIDYTTFQESAYIFSYQQEMNANGDLEQCIEYSQKNYSRHLDIRNVMCIQRHLTCVTSKCSMTPHPQNDY